MAKLYAEITSDKGGRVVGKGGNDYIKIVVKNKNLPIFDIEFSPDTHHVCTRGTLSILNYRDGSVTKLDYLDGIKEITA